MKHTMQEMSPVELEATIGGVTFKEVGAAIGDAIDHFIVALKKVGAGLAELGHFFKELFGFS